LRRLWGACAGHRRANPTHPYLGASPGCWRAFGELTAQRYEGGASTGDDTIFRLAVDTYATQHPGVPGRQSSQSVDAHLFVLCLVLERGAAPAFATHAIRTFLEANKAKGFPWLEPPASLGNVTVFDVLQARGDGEPDRTMRLWAESVWQAWEPCHRLVRAWVDETKL